MKREVSEEGRKGVRRIRETETETEVESERSASKVREKNLKISTIKFN